MVKMQNQTVEWAHLCGWRNQKSCTCHSTKHNCLIEKLGIIAGEGIKEIYMAIILNGTKTVHSPLVYPEVRHQMPHVGQKGQRDKKEEFIIIAELADSMK